MELQTTSESDSEYLSDFLHAAGVGNTQDFDWFLSISAIKNEHKVAKLILEIDRSLHAPITINKPKRGYRQASVSLMGKKVAFGKFETEEEAREAVIHFLWNVRDALLDRGKSLVKTMQEGVYGWGEHASKNGKLFGHVFPAFFYIDPMMSLIIMEEMRERSNGTWTPGQPHAFHSVGVTRHKTYKKRIGRMFA